MSLQVGSVKSRVVGLGPTASDRTSPPRPYVSLTVCSSLVCGLGSYITFPVLCDLQLPQRCTHTEEIGVQTRSVRGFFHTLVGYYENHSFGIHFVYIRLYTLTMYAHPTQCVCNSMTAGVIHIHVHIFKA